MGVEMDSPTTWKLVTDHLKQRILDVVLVWILVGTGLGAYHLYKRIAAHNQIDESLMNILERQDEAQLEQRCIAFGFAKAPAEELKDAAERPTER